MDGSCFFVFLHIEHRIHLFSDTCHRTHVAHARICDSWFSRCSCITVEKPALVRGEAAGHSALRSTKMDISAFFCSGVVFAIVSNNVFNCKEALGWKNSAGCSSEASLSNTRRAKFIFHRALVTNLLQRLHSEVCITCLSGEFCLSSSRTPRLVLGARTQRWQRGW